MKLSDTLKTSCKSFTIKFLEVKNSWNCSLYFAKDVEQNFMKEFSCEQKKKILYNHWHKNNTAHLKYRRVTKGGREGRSPPPFFENLTKVP